MTDAMPEYMVRFWMAERRLAKAKVTELDKLLAPYDAIVTLDPGDKNTASLMKKLENAPKEPGYMVRMTAQEANALSSLTV